MIHITIHTSDTKGKCIIAFLEKVADNVFVCLFVLSRSAIWQLSPLLVTELQI
jgi:hypothetical protein